MGTTKTIDIIKQERKPSEKALEGRKAFNKIRKAIVSALKEGDKTIPQLVEATGLDSATLMYHVMSLRKYGEITETGLDDMDEYYIYKLKKSK